MNMERFQGTLIRFAAHLRNRGEETAAQAVETILKYVRRAEQLPEQDAESTALRGGAFFRKEGIYDSERNEKESSRSY